MKTVNRFLIGLIVVTMMTFTSVVLAQTPDVTSNKTRQRVVTKTDLIKTGQDETTMPAKPVEPVVRDTESEPGAVATGQALNPKQQKTDITKTGTKTAQDETAIPAKPVDPVRRDTESEPGAVATGQALNPKQQKTDITKTGTKTAQDETAIPARPVEPVVNDAKNQRPATTDTGAKTLDITPTTDLTDAKKTDSVTPAKTSDVPEVDTSNRHEQASEEAAVVPYYNNFFTTYRLGPEDVISVSVFGQDRYSRAGIMIPPSGRISLALIPGGVFVNGKTVEEVAETIRKRYDEYIIDPQVSVSLDKASSYRYSVIGDVAQPGIKLMSHRMTVTEALGEAGGVLATGDRSKVVVLRRQADGNLTPIAVNVSAIYKGKAPDTTYLVPGDQVIVPGNKLKTFQKIMTFFPILSFARIFTGGIL